MPKSTHVISFDCKLWNFLYGMIKPIFSFMRSSKMFLGMVGQNISLVWWRELMRFSRNKCENFLLGTVAQNFSKARWREVSLGCSGEKFPLGKMTRKNFKFSRHGLLKLMKNGYFISIKIGMIGIGYNKK